MYDFYGLELCIMYDSHGVYLRVLKLSWCLFTCIMDYLHVEI
jgi:hypothetical protein